MLTSVKLRVEAKENLERLRARLRLRGIKASLQEVLEKLIELGLEREDELAEKLSKLPPLEEDPAWRMLDGSLDWGVREASKRVDEILYGGP